MESESLYRQASCDEEAIAIRKLEAGASSPAGRKPKWPFVAMEIGDSVVIPSFFARRADRARRAASKNKGFKFLRAAVPDGILYKRVAEGFGSDNEIPPYELAQAETPNSWRKKGRPRVWPFYDMKVGDRTTVSSPLDHQKARVSACQASRRTGAKFKSRTRDDGVLVFERIE